VNSTHMQQQLVPSVSATQDLHGTWARVQHVLKANSRKCLVMCSVWTALLAPFPATLERSQSRRVGIMAKITLLPSEAAL